MEYPEITDDEFTGFFSHVSEASVMYYARKSLGYNQFTKIADLIPLDMQEWSDNLHISERTMQRYKKEKKSFAPIYTERILEITQLYHLGSEILGNKELFNQWMNSSNLAIGGEKPKDLLNSISGINLLKDELGRIQHGVFS
jgi:putative toxin-antitoxin system antitoxin component (TIGR02293 family)